MTYLFLNPWDRHIGPNRYLVEILRHAPEVAQGATVVLHEENNARSEYEALGCKVEVWPETAPLRVRPTAANAFSQMRRHVFGLGKVMACLRTLKPDLLVTNSELVWIGGFAARLLGIRHAQVFHAITFAYRLERRPLLLRAFLWLFRLWNHKVIAVSETLREALIAGGFPRKRVVTVPNPIAVDALRAASEASLSEEIGCKIEGRRPLIVSAGRISPIKGQDLLVKAMPMVKQRHPKALCLFAGRLGSTAGFEDTIGYFEGIKAYIRSEGLEEYVGFLDEIEELPALLNCADIYAQPSWTESFGRVVAEALVCGAPVVAFDVGALRETAGPGAILVRKGDAAALGKAVIELFAEPIRMCRMAEEGRAHVAGRFEAGLVAARFLELLPGVCEAK